MSDDKITITVLYFASACDATGLSSESLTFPLPQIRINELEDKLKARHEKLKSLLDVCMFAVNMEYCERDYIVKEGDEVAIIPPVSGG
ncbi:1753_t:CDS:2 [Paraglomus occultum]|uniref:Molybdopterin synthase sulfur carrier subunit n=1 Tax=Paraglomus occultum TaxID=144539 RepID=A0A9N9CQ73_9GLOM|nr:1753_t:CDS:2 [Paraglomus occultum]